ncbi:asparagine--tRNA ligase [Pediococcus acidilactici]|uniref:asparagine--tRNA ligase n=1 Tax=Pediococcus acidilactici TaxID=1254 RepID=UPI0006B69C2C|nr:asparagine--tRNA ligase [Pediococcus acidilactici]KAF0369955.1 asparagine--tRNA ligase [Pediococcus acidilactici]KAF0381822.1 asparagine--tRNA ligase [Pediococcus acidilactici]KAF0455044.1 asparagine--tRNA ligase [Pediococcus acidilactici]KAF0474627.1 asparagine--tRNA ligase [Pediococcus acidilactici]KAF0534642.1 asparagine--tRNA ligase [Pediococcus acidilactici]
MENTLVKSLYAQATHDEDVAVEVTGWLKTLRSSKKISFLEINDGSCIKNVQVIMENGLENYEEIKKAPIYTTLKVVGTVVDTPKAKQPFEIHATEIEVLGNSDSDYPLQKKHHTPEFLREQAHLRPRTNTFYAVFRIRSLAAFAIHEFLQKNNFVYVNTPLITSSDTEGAGEMFKVTTLDLNNVPKNEEGKVDSTKDFFKQPTNLTVSGQLNAEAFALAFRDVYTFGPDFRAEDSHTTRHAAEFWMVEPEMAFANLQDVINVSEDMLKYVINYLLENASDEIDFLNQNVDQELRARLEATRDADFAQITYTEAIDKLLAADQEFENKVEWGIDLQTEHERYLSEKVYQKPVFITDYPRDIKAFYMRENEDHKTVAAVDLLVPGIGELIGGSQREERLAKLNEKIKEFNLDPEEYKWYLELRKYGETEHSGFGIGFERLLMYVTGVENIRDVIPFPRTPGNASF